MSTAVLHHPPAHQQSAPSPGPGSAPSPGPGPGPGTGEGPRGPAAQAQPARCGQLLAARAQALFTSDLSAHREHTRAEVAAAIRHAFGTHHGVDGCAAEVAAAYGEYPETAARRMRWAHAVIQGMDDFAAVLDGAAGARYLMGGTGSRRA